MNTGTSTTNNISISHLNLQEQPREKLLSRMFFGLFEGILTLLLAVVKVLFEWVQLAQWHSSFYLKPEGKKVGVFGQAWRVLLVLAVCIVIAAVASLLVIGILDAVKGVIHFVMGLTPAAIGAALYYLKVLIAVLASLWVLEKANKAIDSIFKIGLLLIALLAVLLAFVPSFRQRVDERMQKGIEEPATRKNKLDKGGVRAEPPGLYLTA